MKIEIFLITNGRGTFPYALKSAKKQTHTCKIHIIENVKWVDALNKCLDICESPFYLRLDDDMFVHPLCVKYMLLKAKKISHIGVYLCKLWEDWSHRPGGYIKLYKTKIAQLIRFRTNKLGKVDKPFFKDIRKTKYKIVKDKSLVGLHACGTIEDEARYRKLWLENNATSYYEEPPELDKARKRYKKTANQQYELIKTLKKKNQKYGTSFAKFMR